MTRTWPEGPVGVGETVTVCLRPADGQALGGLGWGAGARVAVSWTASGTPPSVALYRAVGLAVCEARVSVRALARILRVRPSTVRALPSRAGGLPSHGRVRDA